jgi:ATP-dependent DNA helicase RecQ
VLEPEEAARRKEREHAKLRRMIEYAEASACLRAAILRYFGDPACRPSCAACSNCRPGAIDAHERELLRKILSGIARAGERYGRQRVIAMLRGDSDGLPAALTNLSTTGLLRYETEKSLHGWIDATVSSGLVVVSQDRYRTLSLSEQGRDVMHGKTDDVPLRRPPSGGGRRQGSDAWLAENPSSPWRRHTSRRKW